jgi:dienelactone hydrolase
MLLHSFVFFAILAFAVLAARALALQPGPPAAAPSPAQAQPQAEQQSRAPLCFVQKEMWVPAPQAFPHGLDSLEVYIDRPGHHPLVVLTHGTSDNPDERAHVTPWGQLAQAQWFARRGYVAIVVVRQGYGRSGGKQDSTHGGCGSRVGSFEEAGEASVEDLRAVMAFAQRLPEVDPDVILSAGVSTGGFAQVALSADPPKGLKAAISFAGGRGGDGHEHNCNLDGVIDAFASFGKGAHKHGDLPMLWIYAQNDHWFTPAMAQKFDAAYKTAGGTDEFVMAPADGEDGHHLYAHVAAWSDTVSAFLKEQNLLPLGDALLPAPEPPNVPMPARLGDNDREMWQRFLLAAPFKTLVADENGRLSLFAAAFDQSLADDGAMDRCKKAPGGSRHCSIVARTPDAK